MFLKQDSTFRGFAVVTFFKNRYTTTVLKQDDGTTVRQDETLYTMQT